jgi:hypothetical protein
MLIAIDDLIDVAQRQGGSAQRRQRFSGFPRFLARSELDRFDRIGGDVLHGAVGGGDGPAIGGPLHIPFQARAVLEFDHPGGGCAGEQHHEK